MADTWLTIEQAAVALGLSVRTVNRHIVAGKLQSRLQDGRREVLVQQAAEPNAPPSAAGPSDPASPFAAVNPTATAVSDVGPLPTIAPETVLALADNAAEKAELAISAYQQLARSTDMQFQHVRRSARLAWASVAFMAAGVSVAVGWTAHHLTRAQVEGEHLARQVRQTSAATDKASAERDSLRAELSAAKEQAARAEGQVSTLTDAQARLEKDAKEFQARAAEAKAKVDWYESIESAKPAGGAATPATPTSQPVEPTDKTARVTDN